MAFPIIPVLVVATIGAGAVLLGRAKKITGGGGSGPVTPGAWGGYRVLSRAEAAAIGGSKMTYITPKGVVPAADPAVNTMVASMAQVGGNAALILKPPAGGPLVMAIATIDTVVKGPAYQGHIIKAAFFYQATKKIEPITAGPPLDGKVNFAPSDVIDVTPPADLTLGTPPEPTFET
jgi:hypothetical protein